MAAPFGSLNHFDETRQFIDMRVDVRALRFQKIDTRKAFLDRDMTLRRAIITNIIKIDHFANIGKAEPHPLGAQYPRQPRAVSLGINPCRSATNGRDQPFILVETQRSRSHAKFLRQIGNAELMPVPKIGGVECRVRAQVCHLKIVS